MSRVIKATWVRESLPKTLEYWLTVEETSVLPVAGTANGRLEDSEPRDDESILQETEAVVRELMEKAREHAVAIIEEAHQQAQLILDQAVREAEEFKEEQREKAYRDGYRQGLESAKEEGEAMVAAARLEVEKARAETERILQEREPEIVQLAVAIAAKILRWEIDEQPQLVLNIVRAALDKVRDGEGVIVRVNSRDYPVIQAAAEELPDLARGIKNITIEKDNTILPGGCIVETGAGYVDCQIDKQLDLVRETLLEVSCL